MRSAHSELQVPRHPPHDLIRAAGGLAVRTDPDGRALLGCLYRESQGDWTFPKVAVRDGETFDRAVCRALWERSGVRGTVACFVGITSYTHRKGHPKTVAYFLISAVEEAPERNDENYSLEWLTVDRLRSRLTWESDLEILDIGALRLEEQGRRT